MTTGRLTQQGLETLDAAGTIEGRVAQHGVEALCQELVPGRFTQHGVEVLAAEEVPCRFTQHAVEALCYEPITAGCVTTITVCWEIVRTDGVIQRFTTLDRDFVFDGDTYKTCNSFEPTALESNSDLSAANLELTGIVSDDITEADLLNGKYDFARVTVFRADWMSTESRMEFIHRGRIGAVTAGKTAFFAELWGYSKGLAAQTLNSYTHDCRWELYSVECGINRAANLYTGEITSVTNRRSFACSTLVNAAGDFDYGLIEFTTGLNVGLSREVKSHTASGVLYLWEPFPYDVAVADDFEIVKGCDRRHATCIAKFDNVERFGGFPFIRGNDILVQFPNARGEG